MSLDKKAMLVVLTLGQPRLERVDKKTTDEVLTAKGAARDAARVVKTLFDPVAYAPIKQLVNEIRSAHYTRTLPWLDNGPRLLATAGFMDYSAMMRTLRTRFDTLTAEFVAHYQGQLAAAQARLNGLFNPADYPSVDEVKTRFTFEIGYMPVPTGGDLRVDNLSQSDLDAIRAELEAGLKTAQAAAMRETATRIMEAVAKLAERLADPDGRLHSSLVGNLQELVDVLPCLNVAEDPRLQELANEIDEKLASCDPEDLRKEKDFRAEVAADADEIVKKMAAYMGTLP